MANKFKSWVSALRLRTLPLALSTVMMGGFLASTNSSFNIYVVIMAVITTLLLQILSNLANDYGDAVKGTDNKNRVGPERAVQSGIISRKEMKTGIITLSGLSLISGLLLIWVSLKNDFFVAFVFLVIGLAAIAAAIKYTIGKNAYGYSGFGDIFVFIFFGLTAVCGTYFLATLNFKIDILLPAVTMGFLSIGVLNLNNMRDMENDKSSGKYTIALKLGYKAAKIYQSLLITSALTLLIIYSLLTHQTLISYIYLITFPIFIINLIKISRITDKQFLDPFLKKLALSTLALSILFGVGLCL